MHEEGLVSVVIPVWRDADALTRALHCLPGRSTAEVIVACPLGDEPRYQGARERYPDVRWVSAPRGRASQMNAGAAIAGGRWLLFLHADSELPADWVNVIARADQRAHVVAGAFRLTLDSPDWQARIVELGVRLRVALFGLPYGDQALFIRRHTFEAMGGYRDLPLMEDVDLVRRARARGRLLRCRSAVRTSARRWEREGWMRRSLGNASLATRYLCGASPARLAQRYFGRRAGAVVLMARAPWTGGKTRLAVPVDDACHADLRRALLLDTLDVLTSYASVGHIIACEPAEACEQMRELAGPAIDVIAQRGADLGQRMKYVFEDVMRLGVESIVVVGSDLPDLPSRLLRDAFGALRGQQDRVVLGPATDGGYYLIGMNRLHAALFEQIDWSTDRVLAQTLDAAKAQRLPIVMLEPWADVDSAMDLGRVRDLPEPATARRTRAWGIAHPARD